MFTASRILSTLNWLVALAWLGRALIWRRNLRHVPDLTGEGQDFQSSELPLLSVIVPARNEARNIAATAQSLLNTRGVRLEILLVDDRSTDGTGEVMEQIACEFAASGGGEQKILRVLHVEELPPGWLGKTNAMAAAARQAAGEWLLFTDGDVVFREDSLCRALDWACSHRADHLVLMPTLILKSWGERVMLSFLNVMAIWTVRLWKVPDPRARRDAIGMGAFNLIRREVYDAVGGWESLRMQVIEDLALGFRVKGKGFTQYAVFGRGLIRVRWVEGTFGVVKSLAKNLFAFFRFQPALAVAFLPLFLLGTLFPPAVVGVGSFAWLATAVMIVALVLAYQRQSKLQPFSVWTVLGFPLAALLMFYTIIRSTVVVMMDGGIVWRGTFYPLKELRKNQVIEP